MFYLFFSVKVLPINPECLRMSKGARFTLPRYEYLQMLSNCGNKWKGMLQDSANVATSATNYVSSQSPLAAANTKT